MTPTTNAGERPARMLVYYPGHLGPKPTIETRGRLAEPYDGPGVRDLPAKIGASLVRFSGFFEALPPADAAKRFALHEVDLAAVTTVQYRESPDAPEVDLVGRSAPAAEPDRVRQSEAHRCVGRRRSARRG
jgi:hypothetical protein